MKIQYSNLFVISVATILGTLASASTWASSAEVVLRFKEKVSMEDLAKSVTDPASPRYQTFYSPEEIRAISAPTDDEYASILGQLKAEGLEVVSESATHLFVTVRGERSALEALSNRAKHALALLDFSPAARSLASVNGLTPSQKRRPHLVFTDAAKKPPKAAAGVQPAQIHTLYGFDALYKAGLSGKGQHIAVATYDDFMIGDVTDYYTKNKLKPGPTVDKVVFNGTPTFDQGSAAETQTDAEFSGMIAQGASIHVFTSAQNSDAGELGMFTAILDDNRAKVVNYSWGSCESQLAADHRADMDKVFARAVAQGVNIMVASGDSGSDCMQNGTVVADYPAAHPNVVAVGGTTLNTTGAEAAETAWSGSGGGISTLFDLPDYQANLGGKYVKRSYPDVAFNADPASGQPTWIHYNPNSNTPPAKAAYMVIGGTSIAAPQWSGFLAIVGEARANAKAKELGFLNSHLYAVPAASYSSYFHDSVSGSNGAYSATAGWDATTGFGSMRAATLLDYLKAL